MYTENNHHLWYSRRDMLSYSLSTQIRNHEKSQIRLSIDIHNELHANISSMPVPSASMARLVLHHVNSLPKSYDTLDVTKSLTDRFYDKPQGEHLARQMPFLLLGSEALKRSYV
jgi:hypothetical protein